MAEDFDLRSHLARQEQEEAMRRQEETARRVLHEQKRQGLEKYQEALMRAEQGMQSMRREGDGERRPFGYEPRR